MHAYISGTFCATPNPAVAATAATGGVEDQTKLTAAANSLFRIYPNPTPGKFTLELQSDAASARVHVDIFGILGDRILSEDLLMDRKHEFSIIDRPVGVYVIHVTSGVNSETQKIIRR